MTKRFSVKRDREKGGWQVTDGTLVHGRFADREWARKYARVLAEKEREKTKSNDVHR